MFVTFGMCLGDSSGSEFIPTSLCEYLSEEELFVLKSNQVAQPKKSKYIEFILTTKRDQD